MNTKSCVITYIATPKSNKPNWKSCKHICAMLILTSKYSNHERLLWAANEMIQLFHYYFQVWCPAIEELMLRISESRATTLWSARKRKRRTAIATKPTVGTERPAANLLNKFVGKWLPPGTRVHWSVARMDGRRGPLLLLVVVLHYERTNRNVFCF